MAAAICSFNLCLYSLVSLKLWVEVIAQILDLCGVVGACDSKAAYTTGAQVGSQAAHSPARTSSGKILQQS